MIIFLTGLVVGILLLSEQPGNLQTLAPEPTRGGTYVEALTGNLQRLNPVLDFYNPVDRDVDRLIFSGLIRFDERGVPQPDLAESWGISRDGMIYNFALRPNVKWHDGEPLTSDDVLFTVELLREGGEVVPSDLQAFWKDVEVIALDQNNIQFRLPEPFAPFLDYLSFGVLPRHLLGDLGFQDIVNSPFNIQPIGTGPYRFERLIVENEQIRGVVLSVFDQYYGVRKPYIEQIIFRYYPDSNSALEAYRQGEVDGIGNVTADILPAVLNEPGLAVYTGRKPEIAFVLFNLDNPQVAFFKDSAVRKALFIGLNRQWIIDRLLNGQAILANGPILPGTWAYYDGIKPVRYDVQTAVEMLKQSGYVIASEGGDVREKDGIALRFKMIHPQDELYTAIARSIQSDWAKLGVQVELEALSYDELINGRLSPRDYQAALINLNLSRSPDPDPYPFWDQAQATGGQNYSQWDNRTASEYLEEARVTTDLAERARLYRNFQLIFEEETPAIPLFSPVYTCAVSRDVRGVSIGPLFDSSDRFSTIMDWYLIAKVPSRQNVLSTPSGE